MEQLAAGLELSLKGPLAEKAVMDARECFQQWGLPLPHVEPLVLDFGLGDFYRYGLTEYWIANDVTAGYCGKYMFLFAGQTCPRHRHKSKRESFFLLQGTIKVEYDGREFEMKPGDVLDIALWKYHTFTGVTAAVILELSQPCIISDNYFENTDIPLGANYCPKETAG